LILHSNRRQFFEVGESEITPGTLQLGSSELEFPSVKPSINEPARHALQTIVTDHGCRLQCPIKISGFDVAAPSTPHRFHR
jgi:hypothetical protein